MQRIIAALLAAFITLFAIPALAGDTGVVRGSVTVNGAPKASVPLKLNGEGSSFSAVSDARGGYIFSDIPFGHYTLTATYAGVQNASVQLDVTSDQVSRVDLPLMTGLKTIAVTSANAHRGVSGTPVSVNTISRAQIAALPGNNSLNNVIETVPGIVKFSYNEPVAHGFHGLTYEIDGAPLPQATSSNFAELIDPKNVDSIEVFTGAMPAEYGGSREGAVINILTDRPTKLNAPFEGFVTYGAGNYGQSLTSFDTAAALGNGELFLNANTQHTDRGLDAPTFDPIHDNSSQSDQFLRYLTPLNSNDTLAFDYSNQLAQFEIPINTDPNDPSDPQVSPAGTDDVQREYDRYANLNFTAVSKDGLGVFQFIPWYRSTRIAYDGDLANDVLTTVPDPDTGLPDNLVGLREDRIATYAGVRISDLRTTGNHTIKIGLDANRENFGATQTLAQFGESNVETDVAQAGTQIGLYAQDNWQPSKEIGVNYGLRYDHSTGFVGGDQISPRIGVNIAPDDKNIVHFYYGRFYAAPQLEDVRQSCVVLNGCPTTPVYDLKPETDSYFEMGVHHQFNSSLSGYVNYFMRDVNNVLDTTQLLNTPIFAVFNNTIGTDRGVEFRLDDKVNGHDSWFASGTVSDSEAAGISGSTFLFCPNGDPSCTAGLSSALLLQPEDHDQTYEANGAYTHHFGNDNNWFATLQGEYGSGYPVEFQNGTGRLPTHLLADFSMGYTPTKSKIGFDLDIENVLNHQYIIKIANGFNTTQVSSGRNVLLRLTAPF